MIEILEKKLNNLLGKKEQIEKELEKNNKNKLALTRRQRNIQEAQLVIQSVAKKTQEELSSQISSIVTLALNSIFDVTYEFGIRYEEKRGKTEAHLFFNKNGNEVDPIDDSGGGVVDVASFALRIALWYLSRPRPSNTIILDEPLKFLDRKLQPKASLLLKTLSEKLGIQFIIVSHDEGIISAADKIFEVTNKDGVSEVKEKEKE
jgi:DNA repair exonuclease SbcCD ATPase subunit